MRNLFFTSDTHFGQERTFKYSMRSMYFEDVEEMDLEMIKRWNEMVSENDIVYHLGDFGDYEVAKKLNGRIVLLFGNYERDGDYEITQAQREYFYGIVEETGIIYKNSSNHFEGKDLLMVHEPENKKGSDLFYLFGHIHEKQKVKRGGLNVGVDVHNFSPVSEEIVEFYMGAINNIYDDNCFVNY